MPWTSDWRFTYVNENAKRVLKAMGDVIGKDLRVVFADQQPSTKEKLEHTMTTRQPVAFDSYYERADLSTSITAHPLDDGGITIYFTDISEQKRLERALEQERAQRNQRIEALARLSSGLAHEIKNPLAIIHARASDLAEMAAEGEIDRAEIEDMHQHRPDLRPRHPHPARSRGHGARRHPRSDGRTPTSPHWSSKPWIWCRARYRESGIQLEAAVPDGLPMLECREVQISQILSTC